MAENDVEVEKSNSYEMTDADGRPVDQQAADAVKALESQTDAKHVQVNWCETGHIQYWSKRSYIGRTVVQIAMDHGYVLHLAESNRGPNWEDVENESQKFGYAEFLRVEEAMMEEER